LGLFENKPRLWAFILSFIIAYRINEWRICGFAWLVAPQARIIISKYRRCKTETRSRLSFGVSFQGINVNFQTNFARCANVEIALQGWNSRERASWTRKAPFNRMQSIAPATLPLPFQEDVQEGVSCARALYVSGDWEIFMETHSVKLNLFPEEYPRSIPNARSFLPLISGWHYAAFHFFRAINCNHEIRCCSSLPLSIHHCKTIEGGKVHADVPRFH